MTACVGDNDSDIDDNEQSDRWTFYFTKSVGWYWLLAPDGSPATIEAPATNAEPTREKLQNADSSVTTRPHRSCRGRALRAADTADNINEEDTGRDRDAETDDFDMENDDDDDYFDKENDDDDDDEQDGRDDQTSKFRSYSPGSEFQRRWDNKFLQLKAIYKKHNTTLASKLAGKPTYPKHSKIGRWVTIQRKKYKENKLSKDQIALLESIGFQWKVLGSSPEFYEEIWERNFRGLVEYHKKHKQINNFPSSSKTGRFVSCQRQLKRKGELSADKISRLEALGINWEGRPKWMDMYKRLVAYQQKYKTTQIPLIWKEDPKLATWVYDVRRKCRDPRKIKLLDSIGFEWHHEPTRAKTATKKRPMQQQRRRQRACG